MYVNWSHIIHVRPVYDAKSHYSLYLDLDLYNKLLKKKIVNL